MKRTINQEIEVNPTPEELAESFWDMSEVEQARFFNHLGEIADGLPMQLQAVTDCERLEVKGRLVMQRIGEYGEKL